MRVRADTTARERPSSPLATTSSSRSSETSPSTAETARGIATLARQDGGVVLACEPTAEGILTGVGLGYLAHANPASLRLERTDCCQPAFAETVIPVITDAGLARRVFDGFERDVSRGCSRRSGGGCPSGCSEGCSRRILLAAACDDPGAPEAIHRYLRLAFASGPRVRTLIAHPDAVPFLRLARYASAECERVRQFARLSRMSDGSFVGTVSPRADVLPFVAGYFAARIGTERFCLVDVGHRIAAFHVGGQTSVMRIGPQDAEEIARRRDLSPDEHYVRAMWKRFYDGLELAGRSKDDRGYDLRLQLMPRRVWDGMPEFDQRNDDPGDAVPRRYQGRETAVSGPTLERVSTRFEGVCPDGHRLFDDTTEGIQMLPSLHDATSKTRRCTAV